MPLLAVECVLEQVYGTIWKFAFEIGEVLLCRVVSKEDPSSSDNKAKPSLQALNSFVIYKDDLN